MLSIHSRCLTTTADIQAAIGAAALAKFLVHPAATNDPANSMGIPSIQSTPWLPISDDESADGADLVAGAVILDQVRLRVGRTPDLLHPPTENTRTGVNSDT